MANLEKTYKNFEVLELLERIYRAEVAGINRYLHYSFMVMGHNRIPIQKWFRDNASEAMDHAVSIGEKITSLGGHPPIVASKIEETNLHNVQQLLEESLKFEEEATVLYKKLVTLAQREDDIALEELARAFVKMEVEHRDEVLKMLKRPDGQ